MKRSMPLILLLISICTIPAVLYAQPTINSAGDYTIGTTIVNKICNPAAAGPSGPGQTWNFASLTATRSVTTWIIANPVGSPFPTATFEARSSDSTSMFINKTAANNHEIGLIDSSSIGGGVVLTYTNTLLNVVRPLIMGSGYTDSYACNGVSMSVPMNISGIVSMTADAFGTLMLPNGTYSNTLRLKLTQYDTLIIGSFGSQFTLHQIYMWYDNSHKSPLLTIDSSIMGFVGSVSVKYLESEQVSASSVASTSTPNNVFSAYFNNNEVFVQGLQEGLVYNVTLFNVTGQQIYQSELNAPGANAHFMLSSNLSNGLYFVVLREKNNPGTNVIKVLKQ